MAENKNETADYILNQMFNFIGTLFHQKELIRQEAINISQAAQQLAQDNDAKDKKIAELKAENIGGCVMTFPEENTTKSYNVTLIPEEHEPKKEDKEKSQNVNKDK